MTDQTQNDIEREKFESLRRRMSTMWTAQHITADDWRLIQEALRRAALDGGAVSRSDVALEELINAASKAFDLLYQFGCSAAADRLDKAIVAARGNAPYFHSLDRSHPAETPTDKLVSDFSVALKSKLNAAREKYGHEDEAWQDTGWKAELLEQLHDHLIKGDPRDVAAYCAFAWYHGWLITPPQQQDKARELVKWLRDNQFFKPIVVSNCTDDGIVSAFLAAEKERGR